MVSTDHSNATFYVIVLRTRWLRKKIIHRTFLPLHWAKCLRKLDSYELSQWHFLKGITLYRCHCRKKRFKKKNFNRFVTTSENVTAWSKKWPIFLCFLDVVTSKIALVCLNRMQENTFVPNLVQIGREMADKSWREKKRKKNKSTAKHNITEI